MLEIRDLKYLTSLARHRHFAKAAAECGVSQPAFSMRIRAIEDRLGTSIVKRGNRFQGFTAEGDAIVRHARKILDDVKLLEQEVLSAAGEITGTLNIGVVPTATAYGAKIARALHENYPGIRVRIDTETSLAIQQRIDEGTLDAGLTYSDTVSADFLSVDHLYDESYILLLPAAMAPEGRSDIGWAEAAALPLGLLEPGMQNRRILDKTFSEAGVVPKVIAETSELTTVMAMVSEGIAGTVLPHVLVEILGLPDNTVALPLVDPVVEKSISLVSPIRTPELPTIQALRQSALPRHDKD